MIEIRVDRSSRLVFMSGVAAQVLLITDNWPLITETDR
jgi:hypothetical protein